MKVSIITVCYNAEKTIADAIHSVLSQDYPHIEYIVVDGNSKDGTVEIVQSFGGRISKFISEPDRGIYDAMNKGISMASGDVVGILNSDDLYENPWVISHVVDLFKTSLSDAVYGDLNYVDDEDIKQVKRRWKSGDYERGNFLEGWMPPHPTFFVKREMYSRFGGFNTTLQFAADYELMLRFLYKEEISCAYLPMNLIKMRMGGASNSSIKNRIQANKEDRKAWKLNGLSPRWYTLYKKPISKMGQFFKK